MSQAAETQNASALNSLDEQPLLAEEYRQLLGENNLLIGREQLEVHEEIRKGTVLGILILRLINILVLIQS